MEDIKKVEYEIYNNGFVKVLGVKEVRYTDKQLNHKGMTVDEYGELGLYLRDNYYIIDRKYYLLFKTNSSEYNTTDYGTVKIEHVKDYEIIKKGIYACEIIVHSDIFSYNKTLNIDRCEVTYDNSEKYYAFGMNNTELERIENEASLMASNYAGVIAINYAIGDAPSKDGYLRNYNEYKRYFTNQLILNRSLNNSVEDETFKEKIKKNKSI